MTAKFNFRQSLALLFFLSLNITLFAQSADYTISGKVIDNDLEVPLEYATVSITDVNDPSKVTGGVTDIDGNFAIEVAKGTYNIEVEFISYESKIFKNRTVNSDLNLGTIALGVSSASLDEVVVRAETTQVDVRLDKKIYNIGKDLTTAGGTVSDALNNVPSVSVDVEGGISLRGNENVRILINGKPSAMAGFGSTDVLSQLPADAIERVEVITSPSARYDAEGTAGILNIILRKDKTLGFNGSLTLTGGDPANAGASANINYRTEKFNLFNTTGYRYRESPGNGYNETEYFEEREIPLLEDINYDRNIEDRDMDRENKGFNTNLGLEYYINDQSSITGSIFYRNGDDEDLTTNINDYFLNGEERLGTTRTELETEEDESYQFAVNYINKFNDEGHQLTADFQYDIDNEEQAAFINELVDNNNTGRDEINVPREETNTLEEQREYLLQADYVLPLGENSQFEAGYRGNFENTVTDYELRQENDNGVLAINENQTNIFDYTENVQALYTQYGSKFGDFSFLLGLRLENTNLKGNIDSELTEAELREEFGFQINTDFDNNYLGLFPTVNIIYELGEQENITLGYNRRINRPRGWFINPFPSRNSRTNIFQGNPNLQPAFSNAFDLGYLKRWEKLTLTSSVYFQRETDAFQRVQDNITISGPNNTEVEVIRTLPINLGTNDRIGAEFGLLYNPADWLRLNGSFNFFQFNIDGEYEGQSYSQENNSWFGRFSSKVSLPLGIEWQTNAFYMGPSDEIQGQRDGMLSIDLALSKDIFNDNATISANVSDLLNSRKRQGTTTTDMFTQYSEFQWRQRQINVSLIYRFNQQKNQQRRENRDMNDDDMEGDF
ncbi:Outer membrane receptor proteins, mostly Fe transport [Zunongwangia mangrovi]|uniref:Outer membrane receptor proteins, mostly Fe transport n=1 Tax=Zunongwangia mangrovi TaxID=1334022 RepID=A0A1I1MFR4_9FLAO|nr:outer membrane beta-barrel family protein [Zunongwangia mangrovi]SFC81918.1 Outer membrane receptor proteins, mostly Fe transport [Zunongwangia mangrovi]